MTSAFRFVPLLMALYPALAFCQTGIKLFPYADGWTGGDAAYSIPLDQTKTAWLFGDTFIGGRRAETMIHNSIAIRTCRPNCTVSYGWSHKGTENPDAFFAAPDSNYLWPLDGFINSGRLHIFLEQMHTTGDGGPMGFDYSGVTLANVANPLDPPSAWRISYSQATKGNRVIPGIAAVQSDRLSTDYVYLFTLIRQTKTDSFLGLLRLPLRSLSAQPSTWKWEYLDQGTKWLAWDGVSVPSKAMRLLNGHITEMSVKFHPELGRWVAIFPTPGFPSNTASFSTSERIIGPWAPPRPFYSYPEMTKTDPRYTPQVFCYAAKEHIELEHAGTLAFTYICNSLKESEVLRDWRLYQPQLVKMKFPQD